MKVEVVKAGVTDEISLKDGDVCLLRCGGVVMVEDSEDGSDAPLYAGSEKDSWYCRDGKLFDEYAPHFLDIVSVLGNGQAFYDAVRVKVEVPGV